PKRLVPPPQLVTSFPQTPIHPAVQNLFQKFSMRPKSSSPAPKPKLDPPSPEDTASSESVDWRDPSQMAKLRNELSAYLCGSRREDRFASHRPGPIAASQGKESQKGPSLPEKEAPPSLPEKEAPPSLPEKEAPPSLPEKEARPSVPEESPCSQPERKAATSLTLPPVDYIPQDSPTPSIWQIRNKLEAQLSSSAEKEAKPSRGREEPSPSWASEAEGRSSVTSKPTQGALSSPALPPKISPGREEVPFLYKPHRSQNSPSRDVAVVMPTLSRGEAVGSGEPVEVKEPQGLPAKPPASAPPAEELLRHPVTGEVVERGSAMALLLAARQRAQKGRSRGAALGQSSLPGSLRGHSQPRAGSDSIFYNDGQPNSFTVVPKVPKETEKDPQLTSPGQPKVTSQWKPQPRRDPEGMEPSRGYSWTKTEPQAPVAWERPAPSSLPRGRLLPKSSSSPPPSHKREEVEFNFEVIPPPPEFSNDPAPPPRALQGQVQSALRRRRRRQLRRLRLRPGYPQVSCGRGSPHSNPHYGSSINTFTVRPGTRHPISYAYSGAHRKAPS
ncbi:hypothetical protein E2I00_010895, partial [Balaenoptera physalus]